MNVVKADNRQVDVKNCRLGRPSKEMKSIVRMPLYKYARKICANGMVANDEHTW